MSRTQASYGGKKYLCSVFLSTIDLKKLKHLHEIYYLPKKKAKGVEWNNKAQ